MSLELMSLKLMSLNLMSLKLNSYNYIDVITKLERISREKKICWTIL